MVSMAASEIRQGARQCIYKQKRPYIDRRRLFTPGCDWYIGGAPRQTRKSDATVTPDSSLLGFIDRPAEYGTNIPGTGAFAWRVEVSAPTERAIGVVWWI